MRLRTVAGAIVLAAVAVAVPSPSRAAHHLWKLTQIFSNASGSVQYIQLFTSDPSELSVNGFTITTSTGNSFSFGSNLPGTTTNKWILVATGGLQNLPGGVTPDYLLPATGGPFFATGGGTLNYANVDTWSYGTVPTDGVHSLMRDGSTPVNAAVNFAGQSGSLNLTTAVPAVPRWGIVLLVGGMLVAGSGLLRIGRRPPRPIDSGGGC
jgi:hypothetical protein